MPVADAVPIHTITSSVLDASFLLSVIPVRSEIKLPKYWRSDGMSFSQQDRIAVIVLRPNE
jgi:hypothetical protein